MNSRCVGLPIIGADTRHTTHIILMRASQLELCYVSRYVCSQLMYNVIIMYGSTRIGLSSRCSHETYTCHPEAHVRTPWYISVRTSAYANSSDLLRGIGLRDYAFSCCNSK